MNEYCRGNYSGSHLRWIPALEPGGVVKEVNSLEIQEIVDRLRKLPVQLLSQREDTSKFLDVFVGHIHLIGSHVEIPMIGRMFSVSFNGRFSGIKSLVEQLSRLLGSYFTFSFEIQIKDSLCPPLLIAIGERKATADGFSSYIISFDLDAESQWKIMEGIVAKIGLLREGIWMPTLFVFWPSYRS